MKQNWISVKMGWKKIIILLCVYGFFKEFRPSEAFLSPFLNGPHKNFTEEEINQKIFPVATYSNLSSLVIIFLLTDWLKYKPIIILGCFAGIITWILLPLGKSIGFIQASQFFFGLFSASEVAYYSYMYAKLDKKHYQRATSVTKAVTFVGKATCGLTSQALLYFHLLDYLQLNYITLGAHVIATMWAFSLPRVSQSKFILKESKGEMGNSKEIQNSPRNPVKADKLSEKPLVLQAETKNIIPEIKEELRLGTSIKSRLLSFLKSFKCAIRNKYTVKWSLWWSASLCGYLQVVCYTQLLWQSIINNGDKDQPLYHGYISTAHCIIGAICTYLVGFLKLKWKIYGELTLAICSTIQGCLILLSTREDNLLNSYILFIAFRAVHQSSNTIATSEIAKHIQSDSYALVFGLNTFVALFGQTILTVLVIDYLELNIKIQFFIYGIYYIAIGVVFALCGFRTIVTFWTGKKEKSSSVKHCEKVKNDDQ